MNPADLIERGAEIIRTCGHHKGAYWPDTGLRTEYPEGAPVCVLGSLIAASTKNALDAPICTAYRLLDIHLDRLDLCVSVTGWNDMTERTAEDVIELMLEVAKDYRNTATPENLDAARTM